MCNEKELTQFICNAVLTEPYIDKSDMENSSIYGRSTSYKNGLLFLFDACDELIYISKVGTGKDTSVYDRLVGHGSGGLNEKCWYPEIVKGKFLKLEKFEKFEVRDLEQIKQVAVKYMHPRYCQYYKEAGKDLSRLECVPC